MKVFKGSNKLVSNKPIALTIGNFDGVHLGHREIFKTLIKGAHAIGGAAVVYTFDPHPAKVVASGAGLKLLQTEEQRLKSFQEAGIDICVIEPFTLLFAKISAQDFLHNTILKKIAPRHIVIGHDLTFGWHRKGTVEIMEKFCRANGIKFNHITPVFEHEILISSSQIRKFASSGKIESANACLGRPFSITGTVVRGRGIGKTIGIHTANLATKNELIPASGVYITRALDKLSLTNIGYNPTVGGSKLSIETHIIDFDGDLYHKEFEILFYKRIRQEMVFKDTTDLKAQIAKDIHEAKKYEKI